MKYIIISIALILALGFTYVSRDRNRTEDNIDVNMDSIDRGRRTVVHIKCGNLVMNDTLVHNFKLVKDNTNELVFISGHSTTFRNTLVYNIENHSIKKRTFPLDRINLDNLLAFDKEIFPYISRKKLIIIGENGDKIAEYVFHYPADDVRFELIGDQLNVYRLDSLLTSVGL